MKGRLLKTIALVVLTMTWAVFSWGERSVADKSSASPHHGAQKLESVTGAEHLVPYEIDIFGPTLEAAVGQAEMHAVRSAVGEFYCSDEMLLGRRLVDNYLRTYYKKFLTSSNVLSRRESQGTVYVRVSLIVDKRALEEDLRRVRFFYRPRRRPFVNVAIAETMDNVASTSDPLSRAVLHEVLVEWLGDKDLIKPFISFPYITPPAREGVAPAIPGPPVFEAKEREETVPRVYDVTLLPTLDLTRDPVHLEMACEAAERVGVEVFLTGSVAVKFVGQKKIHFDDFFSFNARVSLALIRVDDGERLDSGTYEAEASHRDKETARRLAISRVARKVLTDMMPPFQRRWERSMTDYAHFQVMMVGVNAAESNIIQDRLSTELTGAEVYRRSLFEDVAVFNLYYAAGRAPVGERERIENMLRSIVAPRFKILPPRTPKQIYAMRIR